MNSFSKGRLNQQWCRWGSNHCTWWCFWLCEWLQFICGREFSIVSGWICVVTTPMVRCNSCRQRVAIGLLVTVLKKYSKYKRKWTATVVAILMQHDFYARLVHWLCMNPIWWVHLKYNTNIRKGNVWAECSKTVKYFFAFKMVFLWHFVDFMWFHFFSVFIFLLVSSILMCCYYYSVSS